MGSNKRKDTRAEGTASEALQSQRTRKISASFAQKPGLPSPRSNAAGICFSTRSKAGRLQEPAAPQHTWREKSPSQHYEDIGAHAFAI